MKTPVEKIEMPFSSSVWVFVERNRLDLGICLTLTTVAAVLRFWHLTDLGLTHFDEGSYAMTGRWLATFGKEGWIYQSGHAPGLFPTLVGLFFLIFGIKDFVAIAVSALTGSLTVGLIYWVGREQFNRKAGVLAALFLATAEYHLMYSRFALTDATFTLFFGASLASLLQGLVRNERRWFIIGGVLTGLCWNTKYHGFFPLLILGLWLGMMALMRRRTYLVPTRARWSNFGIAVLLAGLIYLPWFLFVQFSVGYGAILQAQADHSIGQSAIILTPPATIYFYLTEWLSPALLLAAVLGSIMILTRPRAETLFSLFATALFAIAAMFYTSFPRLLLPVVPGLCLFAAHGVERISCAKTLMWLLAAVVLAWNMMGAQRVLSLRTDAYRQAAAYLQKIDAPVFTQMSKNFYFYEKKKSVEMRWHEPDTLDAMMQHSPAVVIAVDPIIHRFPQVERWLEKYRKHLRLAHEIPIHMFEPVYYQGFDPAQRDRRPLALAPFRPGQAKIEIYRVTNEREQK